MLVIVFICIFGAIAFGLGVVNDCAAKNEGWKKSALKQFLIFAVCIGVCIGFYQNINTNTSVDKKEYNLIALQDSKKEDFHFNKTIFTMKIDKNEKQVYRFYYQDKNGEIKYEEKDINDVSLVYTSDVAKYEVVETTSKSVFSAFGHNSEVHNHTEKQCKLYIPEGSIITDIEIDMQ